MSPSTLRRYRAERLLRQEFDELREGVLRSVRGRLRARGVRLDGGDLEACYAAAWQGLYAAVYAGEDVANPAGWLTVVTFRRAIDEHRAARVRGFGDRVGYESARAERAVRTGASDALAPGREPDLAAELDDRAKLRQLFEALRGRLDARECEAATLCYLQGLTRAQAARRMGISEARMTKLMEGRGAGRLGVAAKVGELLEAIGGGRWCEQQGSLMRAFAFGLLDPRGERYRLARLHQQGCPACRAYVLSLRGLAAVLPPLPLPFALLPHPPSTLHPVGAKAGAGTNSGVGVKASAGSGAGARVGVAGAGAKAGAGGGTVATPGAAAAGASSAAGGGWLLGGSAATKLAVGCLLALGVGCVAITATPRYVSHSERGDRRHSSSAPSTYTAVGAPIGVSSSPAAALDRSSARSAAKHAPAIARVSPTARAAIARRAEARHAQREFGLERPAAATTAEHVAARSAPAVAHVASVAQPRSAVSATEPTPTPTGPSTAPTAPSSRAEREFGPE